jgi:hypothetical protein
MYTDHIRPPTLSGRRTRPGLCGIQIYHSQLEYHPPPVWRHILQSMASSNQPTSDVGFLDFCFDQ